MKYCTVCNTKYDDNVSFCSVDGEVLEDDPSSIVGTDLDGQYHIEAMLGKGGMGAVYRARHILLGDRVAIKVLPPHVRNNAEWLRRFRREGQAARRFRHPNSVTVHDLRTAPDGTTYMVMEYVEGHTLDAELKRRGRFSAREALEILTPIMSVLETAHSMGVVHRDLKPENIMVGSPTETGVPVVKLLDLGIAKMREIAGVENASNTALTMAGQVLGTPYYMSPEQWGEIPRDQNVEIDGRADIYSLGLVFYELLTGRRCYSGTTLQELRREHISTAPRPISEVAPDVPSAFSDAITKATAKDRGDRQSTARELETELRASLESDAAVRARMQPPLVADTIAIDGATETHSDVNAPTIITLDGSGPGVMGQPTPAAKSTPMADATVVEHAPASQSHEVVHDQTVADRPPSLASSVTIPQVLTKTASQETPSAPKRSKLGLALVATVVLIVVVGGVAGVLIYLWKTQATTPAVTGTTGTTVNAPQQIGSYWLELEGADEVPTKVADLVPIASGQNLQLHFRFGEDGYIYLIGPGGDTNQPTAFLTSKPPEGSGLTSNQVKKAVDFSFPSGTNWLSLDKNPGTDVFKVIFSKTALSSPSFLSEPVTLKPLTSAQLKELAQFESKYKQPAPEVELDESNKKSPFMRIKAAPERLNNPIVFDIRIQHNRPPAGN
ncbi:MAG TPA: serine/threonine-protein kinase [Pyrinomonadaceae bacterium]